MSKLLTIVIPSKNEGTGLIDVLSLLDKQDSIYDIIIADSSDDPKSLELLKSINPSIQIIPGGLPSVARNNGAKLVTTPYVLFLDADIHVTEPTLLREVLQITIDGSYLLSTVKYKTLEKEFGWIYRVFDPFQWISSKTKPFAVGGFMLFHTETFWQLGGFNEEDKVAEDYHLSSKVKPKRFKLINRFIYTPNRRFRNKGFWYMLKLSLNSWLNRNNDEWFKHDYNYWK